jgi:PAS domain S-box-containing protein
MKQKPPAAAADPGDEIAGLVQTLHLTQRRLEELTGGQVDAVLDEGGQSYLLRDAQGRLRESESNQRRLATTMMAILNALPAHICLLDANGVIVSVNESWRLFAMFNDWREDEPGVERNYLEICDRASGPGAEDAHKTAAGIRAVLRGESHEFSLEYPCDTPDKKLWFQVVVAPVGEERPGGAVVMHIDITERKLAEESMRQSEERFRSMFTAAATGIAISTPEGRFLQANEAYCRMLGYTEEELQNRTFASVTHPDDLNLNLELRDDVLAGRRSSFVMEKRYIKKTGEIVWTRHSVAVSHAAGGEIAALIVVAEDITERRQAEEALRTTAGSLAVSQSISHLGSWEMDLVHLDNLRANPLRWSDEMYRIFGYLPQSIPVTPDFYLQHVPGPDREMIEQRLQEVLRDNRQRSYFYPVTRSGGEKRIVHTQAQVLMDEKTGRPLKLFGTVHDVTEVKRNEEQILAETALLEAQLNSTLDGIMVVDNNGRKVLQNQRTVDLWKMPADVAAENDHFKRLGWLASQTKNPDAYIEKVSHFYQHPDEIGRDEIELNNGRFLDRYTAPVRGLDGRYYGRIWVFRDISERKCAEKKMAEQMQLLTMAGRVGRLGAWAAEYPGPKLIWSDEIYHIYEVEPGFEVTHESALNFFVPESRRKLEAVIESRQAFDLELEIVTGKGNKRTVRTTSALEQNDGTYRLYGICQDITDRKQQEARMRRLIDSNVQSVLIWSNDGAVLEANDAFCNLTGYSREDFKSGRINWNKLTPPEEAARDQLALQEIEARGVCTPYEKTYIRKDGVRIPILVGSASFEDNPNQGVAFVVDLSEQKRTEMRLSRMVQSNAQGVMFWKASGPITAGNDAFLRLVGYTREDLEAGRIDWKALTPPEYLEADRRALEQIAASGVCDPVEKEWIRKDGSRVPVYLSAGSFEDTPEEGVTFALDLTERKRMEARFRRLIDSNVQNVMFWKKNGEVSDANDAFLKLVGYTREDLQAGRINWMALTPPEYAEADNNALEEIAERGICKAYEKEYIRKNGTRVPVLIGAAAFEDNPEEGVRFVLDLTEIKKLEHQFLRAQRMESIGTLAGGIAHDLNNILAPIMMAVQVLKMNTTEPQMKTMLETIEVSSKRGADIVRQVLSFARGLQGERVEVQPIHLLKDIETIIRDTFPKNIHRDVFFPEEAWTILGDPTQLHQILLNLCVNARDAMPNGGNLAITVENALLDDQYVAMNIQAKPGRYVIIDVADTGEGIPPDILDKIFDPFFTTKEVGKGTGLGLSTVMAIVKSHGGFVNVYSEVGKGSSFKVYLPALETVTKKQRDTVSLATLPRGHGERILIIDDEASILTITSQTLEAFGYKTITAADGAEAIAIYAQQRNKIAAVLTDMAMPVMDGPATIRALQKVNPDVKIIAATGLKTEGSEAKALNNGVKFFLTKPYTAGTLLKTLRAVLEEPRKAGP